MLPTQKRSLQTIPIKDGKSSLKEAEAENIKYRTTEQQLQPQVKPDTLVRKGQTNGLLTV